LPAYHLFTFYRFSVVFIQASIFRGNFACL
jgi:hypothetical protein